MSSVALTQMRLEGKVDGFMDRKKIAREKKRGKGPRTPKRLMRLFSAFPIYDGLESGARGEVRLRGISFLVRAPEAHFLPIGSCGDSVAGNYFTWIWGKARTDGVGIEFGS